MVKTRTDLAGQRFGRWTVLEFAGLDKSSHSRWLCQCDCGSRAVVHGNSLRRGATTSCGCYRNDRVSQCQSTHREGSLHLRTKEYRAWTMMKYRCRNSKYQWWSRYGGRGIKVCDRWIHSFENFLADVGRAPGKEYTIDRKDNDGDYDRGNVRWATAKERANNRRCGKKKEMAA